jgi:cellulose synthase/poly-beta-1,6-N-acetylglucosamine synthase-like glycosyltransferase
MAEQPGSLSPWDRNIRGDVCKTTLGSSSLCIIIFATLSPYVIIAVIMFYISIYISLYIHIYCYSSHAICHLCCVGAIVHLYTYIANR